MVLRLAACIEFSDGAQPATRRDPARISGPIHQGKKPITEFLLGMGLVAAGQVLLEFVQIFSHFVLDPRAAILLKSAAADLRDVVIASARESRLGSLLLVVRSVDWRIPRPRCQNPSPHSVQPL